MKIMFGILFAGFHNNFETKIFVDKYTNTILTGINVLNLKNMLMYFILVCVPSQKYPKLKLKLKLNKKYSRWKNDIKLKRLIKSRQNVVLILSQNIKNTILFLIFATFKLDNYNLDICFQREEKLL